MVMKGDAKEEKPVTESTAKVEEIRPEEDDESHSCRTFVIAKEDHTLGNALRLQERFT